MKIQYISDIHLEFCKIIPTIKPIAPILCLAGDIGHPNSDKYTKFLQNLNKTKEYEKIFLITGNHEYHKQCVSIEQTNQNIKYLLSHYNLHKISFLNNSSEYYNGYMFIGTTLWSHIYNRTSGLTSDFNHIKDLNIDKYNDLHKQSKNFLKNQIEMNKNKKIIVITHFLPSFNLIEEKYKHYALYNQCFASNCNELIKSPIILWIYGHTHSKNRTIINNVNLVCNPIGYPKNNNVPLYEECIYI